MTTDDQPDQPRPPTFTPPGLPAEPTREERIRRYMDDWVTRKTQLAASVFGGLPREMPRLPDTPRTRLAQIKGLLAAGIITPNEARALFDLPAPPMQRVDCGKTEEIASEKSPFSTVKRCAEPGCHCMVERRTIDAAFVRSVGLNIGRLDIFQAGLTANGMRVQVWALDRLNCNVVVNLHWPEALDRPTNMDVARALAAMSRAVTAPVGGDPVGDACKAYGAEQYRLAAERCAEAQLQREADEIEAAAAETHRKRIVANGYRTDSDHMGEKARVKVKPPTCEHRVTDYVTATLVAVGMDVRVRICCDCGRVQPDA